MAPFPTRKKDSDFFCGFLSNCVEIRNNKKTHLKNDFQYFDKKVVFFHHEH